MLYSVYCTVPVYCRLLATSDFFSVHDGTCTLYSQYMSHEHYVPYDLYMYIPVWKDEDLLSFDKFFRCILFIFLKSTLNSASFYTTLWNNFYPYVTSTA
jgi:hypothetical protein